MKKYFLQTAGTLALLAFTTAGAFAQDDVKTEKDKDKVKRSEDVIIIRPKTEVNTKVTVEINGDDIKINGKPMSEFKDDNLSITRRKEMRIEGRGMATISDDMAPRTRFRSGGATIYTPGQSYSYSTSGNKAFLGVGSEKKDDGVEITSVSEGSGAEKAGLKEGDIITKINDIKIESPSDLTKTIGKFNPDDKITVTYKRDKKEQKTTATLSKRKSTSTYSYSAPNWNMDNFKFDMDNNNTFLWNVNKRHLGLKAQETEDSKGLKVLDVDDESAAEKAGIKEGDIITSFDGTEVNNIDKLRELSKTAMDKSSFKIKLLRDGKSQEVEVKIPKPLKTTSL